MRNRLTIEEAKSPEDRRAFIRFPWTVYRDDPYWFPPLVSERVEFLDPDRHPFYEHADVTLFLARRGGEVVGTIAALVNHLHNEYWNEEVGFFGLFEVINDEEVAQELLSTACDWVRDQGMKEIRGPANFSTNEEIGLLVDGWDGPPVIMMTYNPPYYVDLIEGAGFVKAVDMYAYITDLEAYQREGLPERALQIAERVRKRRGLITRPIDMRNFDQEVQFVKKLYNSAWSKNWGFVPLTDNEIKHIAAQLRQIVDPDICRIVEKEGTPVGFILVLPDLNKPLRKAYPHPDTPEWWTMLKLFWHWKVRGSVDTARGYAGGIVEEHRGVGGDALIAIDVAQALLRKGYRYVELSWILESNMMTRRIAQAYNSKVYRTYRVYKKAL